MTTSMFDGSTETTSHLNQIHNALDSFLSHKHRQIAEIDPRVDQLTMVLSDFVLSGGKRIRPRFALAGWIATTGTGAKSGEQPQPDSSLITACAALELIQACALLHDDIIDSSDTRRGRPTAHRAVAALHQNLDWEGDSARYGESQTILLGDLALAWADEMFLGSGAESDALFRALEPWYSMKTEVLAGQMLDVLAEASGVVDEDTPRRVNRFKTAAYTVERPLHIGAALAGATPEAISALRHYGQAVGQAFQLRDDLLGVFGDPTVTGKPSGDDLREGKRTLLIARGISLATTSESHFLFSLLGTDLSDIDLDRARSILRDCGAVASIETEIVTLTEEAMQALEIDQISEHGRTQLRALAEAATRRTS